MSCLTPNHLHMLVQGSGILPQVVEERGYHSVQGQSGYKLLRSLGFPHIHAKLGAGLVLPLHSTDGQQPISIFRPDHPEIDKDGRLRKYLLPKGEGVRIDYPPRCLARIGDPKAPLWVTEGQKKADALASHGATAIALLGRRQTFMQNSR